MYRVVIVDDEKMVLNSLALGFDWQSTDFRIVETFQSSLEAREQIPLIWPDLVLCDIKMPQCSGLELMAEIHAKLPMTQFIFITGYEEFRYAQTAIALGAAGYIVKPIDDDELLDNLRRVHRVLEQRRKYVQHSFSCAVAAEDRRSSQQLQQLLAESFPLEPPFALAASVGALGLEWGEALQFHAWSVEEGFTVYLMPQPQQLRSPWVRRQLQTLLLGKAITSFKFIYIRSWEEFHCCLSALHREVYRFFFAPVDVLDSMEISPAPPPPTSGFLSQMEQACRDRALREVTQLLAEADVRYPQAQRTMAEAVRLHHLVTGVLEQEQAEPPTPMTSAQLVACYNDMQQMISKLLERCYETVLLNQEGTARAVKNETFRQILQYIYHHYTTEISFAQLSRQFSINPSYLSQTFKRELGITFTQYLTDLRIKKAEELLRTTGLSIAEVGERAGFSQYVHFSKVFKKTVGVSPSTYRKSCQGDGGDG